jgi:predicted dithiol-disulfide oxidoreductase (DUF899 family)
MLKAQVAVCQDAHVSWFREDRNRNVLNAFSHSWYPDGTENHRKRTSMSTETITSERAERPSVHAVVSYAEWLLARQELLSREKELTRLRDELSRLRRKLPWVKIEKTYLFDAPDGRVSLAELFDGRSQLVVYHFMSKQMGIPPEQADFCPTCSIVGDHINTDFVHLAHRDVTLVAITLAPLARIEPVKLRMGWQFTFVSSHGTDFNRDFGVLASQQEVTQGKVYYNYEHQDWTEYPSVEKHGLSVFYKDAARNIYHTYSTYGRGCEELLGVYYHLDLVPKGRDEDALPFPMAWIRHRDRYRPTTPSPSSAGCACGAAEARS